jgi:hypothetical protein
VGGCVATSLVVAPSPATRNRQLGREAGLFPFRLTTPRHNPVHLRPPLRPHLPLCLPRPLHLRPRPYRLRSPSSTSPPPQTPPTVFVEVHRGGGMSVGVHVRRGDVRPWEYAYAEDYVPLVAYIGGCAYHLGRATLAIVRGASRCTLGI